mmetsp:Transcript_37478/g.98466  ORF Transcript_37478/g.98466 Transcript_37478/m.98466 type:complete len:306 (-) Transcript_37478:108-1025(-)
MRKEAAGQRQARRHQEGWPIDGVEAQDVLADHVKARRPVLGELRPLHVRVAEGRDVIRQRVEPHVHHVTVGIGHVGRRRVAWHRDAPTKRRARDREVAQAVAHERQHLVTARRRLDEVGVRCDVGFDLLAVRRQLEEVRRLRHPLDGSTGRRLAVDELRLRVEGLIAHRVPALVRVEVDVARREQLQPQRLRRRLVRRVRRPDELIRREAVRRDEFPERVRHSVREGLRRLAGGVGRLLDLLAMLVRPREEVHLVAVQPLEARHHVARERSVRVADVRHAVHIVDGRRHEEGRLLRRGGREAHAR